MNGDECRRVCAPIPSRVRDCFDAVWLQLYAITDYFFRNNNNNNNKNLYSYSKYTNINYNSLYTTR